MQSVALAPQHTGGDVDRPGFWVPVCADHLDGWYDDLPEDERLPIIPRNGVALSAVQAEAILAATRKDDGLNRITLNYEVDGLDDALDALAIGLTACDSESPPS